MKIYFLLFSIFISITGHAQSVEDYVAAITKARTDVEINIDRKPYKKEQHTAFKTYFTELNDLIVDLGDYPRLARRFQGYVEEEGVKIFCKKVFLDKGRWNDLIASCSKNGFFLCTEEAKAFGLYKEAMKKLLREDLQKEFLKAPECQI